MMNPVKVNNRGRQVHIVAVSGIVGNVLLLAMKLVVGLSTKSQAMIADGLNSAGDVFASGMTYVGNHIASRPDDEDHPYGHGKAEYLFSMIISLSLLLVAISIFRSSLTSLMERQVYTYSIWLVVVALSTMAIKFGLFTYARAVGKRHNSLLAHANAEDHRNDIFVSSLTLITVITGYFNFYIIDALAGMAIALWIGMTGAKIFASSYQVLMDTTIEEAVKAQMKSEVEAIEGVDHLDALVSKPVGLNHLLIVKISIDGNLTISQGHALGVAVKDKLMHYELVDDVVVHLNPAQEHPQKDYLK